MVRGHSRGLRNLLSIHVKRRLGRATYVEAVTQTRNDACDDHLRVAEGRRLQNGADNHDHAAEGDRPATAETVAEPQGRQRPDQAADFLQGRKRDRPDRSPLEDVHRWQPRSSGAWRGLRARRGLSRPAGRPSQTAAAQVSHGRWGDRARMGTCCALRSADMTPWSYLPAGSLGQGPRAAHIDGGRTQRA
jgi:hypothetical protein